MYPRIKYRMTQEDLEELLAAMRSQPVLKIGNYCSGNVQERANTAWANLAAKMGFDWLTVKPDPEHPGDLCAFTAVPAETPEQKSKRLEQDRESQRQAKLLREEIAQREEKLRNLLSAKEE